MRKIKRKFRTFRESKKRKEKGENRGRKLAAFYQNATKRKTNEVLK